MLVAALERLVSVHVSSLALIFIVGTRSSDMVVFLNIPQNWPFEHNNHVSVTIEPSNLLDLLSYRNNHYQLTWYRYNHSSKMVLLVHCCEI